MLCEKNNYKQSYALFCIVRHCQCLWLVGLSEFLTFHNNQKNNFFEGNFNGVDAKAPSFVRLFIHSFVQKLTQESVIFFQRWRRIMIVQFFFKSFFQWLKMMLVFLRSAIFLRKCVICRLLAILSPWTSGGLLDFANLERKRFLSMSCTFGAPTSGLTIATFKDKMTCTYSFERRLKILKLLSYKLF